MIQGSGSQIWILTFPHPGSRLGSRLGSQNQGSKRHWIPEPRSLILIRICSGCRGKRRLLTFNGRCCLNTSLNWSALKRFYVQKKILRIFYFDTISLIFPVFQLWSPAHLFLKHLVQIQHEAYANFVPCYQKCVKCQRIFGRKEFCKKNEINKFKNTASSKNISKGPLLSFCRLNWLQPLPPTPHSPPLPLSLSEAGRGFAV